MSAEVFQWAAMVPELACSDLRTSLKFYVGAGGGRVEYERAGFAYLTIGLAQIMLEQAPNDWPVGPLKRPFGRGVNFQIEVADVDTLAARLAAANVELYREQPDKWYDAKGVLRGQRELLVQDPDGYLLRFHSVIGTRKVQPQP